MPLPALLIPLLAAAAGAGIGAGTNKNNRGKGALMGGLMGLGLGSGVGALGAGAGAATAAGAKAAAAGTAAAGAGKAGALAGGMKTAGKMGMKAMPYVMQGQQQQQFQPLPPDTLPTLEYMQQHPLGLQGFNYNPIQSQFRGYS